MKFYVRLDEANKTPEQLAQRERTYQAAKVLEAAGFHCHVQEHFTGDDMKATAASIILEK